MRNNLLLLIGRTLLSILFLVSGFQKFGELGPMLAGMLGQMDLPFPMALTYLMGFAEIGGGIALVFGFQTRIVSVLLAAWCVLTGIVAHAGAPLDLMKNLAIPGGFLILAATWPGAFALRSLWPKRDGSTAPSGTVLHR
ncbi:DoxX family protein [Shinella kummerowiae]|uniref:DoxX family protein n=1 Tax=Shinella kummerowiae TaxID=417745 RepID=UPI0021B621C0|nr:DoxX family protein [Shinella kummerowiae]MCT7664224.1 DoxX family protein [Shinella kummerowiae]